jgi:beta-barrel assembly-enhancing protease
VKVSTLAFGPGLPSAGRSEDIEVNESGVRASFAGMGDGAPRWEQVDLQKSGWDGSQLRLEWKGASGLYSVNVSDAAAVREIARLAGPRSRVKKSGMDRGTRILIHAGVWLFVVLPILAIVALISQHDRIAVWAVNQISIEQEAKLGEIVFTQQKAQLKLVEGPALDMVKSLGERLTKESKYKYQFHVADDNTVNAFAMPGGYVVMHTGLLRLAANAEEVAGVLAHEVQHVERRHSLRGMVQSLGVTAIVGLIFGDLGAIASMGGDLLKLKFSRDNETEADREGLKALVAAKINPSGMRDFFGRMAEQSKIDLGILSTHPASDERMADMDRLIKALPEEARQLAPLPIDYAAIKAVLGAKK